MYTSDKEPQQRASLKTVQSHHPPALSDPSVWLDGLLCFHPIFQYLEQTLPANQLTPDIHHAKAIEADIRFYCAQLGLNADSQLSERRLSVSAYLDHLRDVAAENPQLLMAYAYHLYMGMLSGGQIINRKRRMFAKLSLRNADAAAAGETSAAIDDGYRTTMFDEVNGPKIGELKTAMRELLNELGNSVDARTRQRLLEESIQVFELNNAMIHSIRGGGMVAIRKVCLAVGIVALAVFVYKFVINTRFV